MALLLFTFFVWEQHTLGDFGSVAMNKRIFKNQTTDKGDVPFFKISTFGKKADSFISNNLFEKYKEKYPYPQKGDLLISASGSIGRIVEYKGQKAYYQDSNIVWLNHNKELLNIYLKAYYQIIHWHGIEGSTIKRLYNKNILATSIFVPDKKEQYELGKLIKKAEKIISLQQRRLESFQFTYHEIIRRLFLKKAKWQQTKLSDLVTILDKNRKPVKKEDRLFGDTPYYGANGIQDYISGFTHKGEFILIAEDGANNLTEYPIYFVKGQIWVNNHAHVLKVNKDVSPLFLTLALKQINYSKYTVGSSRNKLNLKDLENIAIFIPDNNEQQKIGQFYSNYLNYLRINKKRIQYMKQFKQFLLQNMFI
ncbi:restriction endonuclease subunit S [Lactobacillus gallinarum]|uniref:restriction endonuclease subunit S n=1 Tax=Lactobacillus gallinarum TaxID=52242 RepID=UPI00242F44F9|nr:restriction endonuclease subunit S [Lactobacillus gallinarum]